MKNLVIFGLMFGLVASSFAGDFKLNSTRGLTSGTVWSGYSYANSDADTSQTVWLRGWTHTELLIEVNDSVDVTVSFLPSYDGVTFSPKVAIGSAWDFDVTSGVLVKGFAIPDGYRSCAAVRFELTFDSAGNGVTTPTLDALIYQSE